MDPFAVIFAMFLALVLGAILWAWWQKFVHGRPDRYGKGPGHDLRGIEGAGRTIDRRDDYTKTARHPSKDVSL